MKFNAGIVIRFAIGLALCSMLSTASARDSYVKPHFRKNGTYSEGHHRTTPNATRLDNYSTQGNFNPYTGKQGTKPMLKPLDNYSKGWNR